MSMPMCPECHAVGGPDGVTNCDTCLKGEWFAAPVYGRKPVDATYMQVTFRLDRRGFTLMIDNGVRDSHLQLSNSERNSAIVASRVKSAWLEIEQLARRMQ